MGCSRAREEDSVVCCAILDLLSHALPRAERIIKSLSAYLMQSTAHALAKVGICSHTCAEQATGRRRSNVGYVVASSPRLYRWGVWVERVMKDWTKIVAAQVSGSVAS
jgi:hypothetical protein